MRVLARQLSITAALMLLLWLALERAAGVFPVMRTHVETSSAHASLLHASENAQLVGELHLLATGDGAKMILIGGSDMQNAFRPESTALFFSGYQVSSLSVNAGYGGGDVVDEMRILGAAVDVMSPTVREKSVFVIGISIRPFYSEYFHDVDRGLGFDAARKKMFPRLFEASNEELRYVINAKAYVLAARFVRPFFAGRRFWEVWSKNRDWHETGEWLESPSPAPPQEEVIDCSDCGDHPEFSADALREIIGDVYDSPSYAHLDALLSYAERKRVRIVLVALPFPPSVQRELPEFRQFIRAVRERSDAFDPSLIRFVDISDFLGDGSFKDMYHLKDEVSPLCSRELRKQWPFGRDGGVGHE